MKRRDVFSRVLGFLGVAGVAAALPESPKSGSSEESKQTTTSKFVTEAGLQHLPPELYILPGYRKNQVIFNITDNNWCVGDQYLVARIRSSFDPELHKCYGLQSSKRADGKQIIKQWALLHGVKFQGTAEECRQWVAEYGEAKWGS